MVLSGTHKLCFEQKYEEYQNFLSEVFHLFGDKIRTRFLYCVVKFSVYLNKFVMCILIVAGGYFNRDRIKA